MADEADRGNDTAELFLQAALLNRKGPTLPHGIGICFNCAAAVEGDARWCDAECRQDWEQHGKK